MGPVEVLIYALFLIGSGIAMLVLTGMRNGQTKRSRIWTGIFGAGLTLYGLYLLLFFRGGQVFIFYYVFIVPILLLVQHFRRRKAMRAAMTSFGPLPGYGQPQSFGQPLVGYGQPQGYGQPPADKAQPPASDGQPGWPQQPLPPA
jgi:hypothetical protein